MSGNAKRQPLPADTAQNFTINLPDTSSIPSGTQGAVLVLGVGLASVSLWSDTLHPLIDSAWSGKPLNVTLPASGVLSLVLFVGALVFISDLNSDFAQAAFWFVLALWVVWLVMHPDTVQSVAGWLSQGAQATAHAQQAPATDGSGGASHTVR